MSVVPPTRFLNSNSSALTVPSTISLSKPHASNGKLWSGTSFIDKAEMENRATERIKSASRVQKPREKASSSHPIPKPRMKSAENGPIRTKATSQSSEIKKHPKTKSKEEILQDAIAAKLKEDETADVRPTHGHYYDEWGKILVRKRPELEKTRAKSSAAGAIKMRNTDTDLQRAYFGRYGADTDNLDVSSVSTGSVMDEISFSRKEAAKWHKIHDAYKGSVEKSRVRRHREILQKLELAQFSATLQQNQSIIDRENRRGIARLRQQEQLYKAREKYAEERQKRLNSQWVTIREPPMTEKEIAEQYGLPLNIFGDEERRTPRFVDFNYKKKRKENIERYGTLLYVEPNKRERDAIEMPKVTMDDAMTVEVKEGQGPEEKTTKKKAKQILHEAHTALESGVPSPVESDAEENEDEGEEETSSEASIIRSTEAVKPNLPSASNRKFSDARKTSVQSDKSGKQEMSTTSLRSTSSDKPNNEMDKERRDSAEKLQKRKDSTESLQKRKDSTESLQKRKDSTEGLQKRKDSTESLQKRKDSTSRKTSSSSSNDKKVAIQPNAEAKKEPNRKKSSPVIDSTDRRKSATPRKSILKTGKPTEQFQKEKPATSPQTNGWAKTTPPMQNRQRRSIHTVGTPSRNGKPSSRQPLSTIQRKGKPSATKDTKKTPQPDVDVSVESESDEDPFEKVRRRFNLALDSSSEDDN